MSEATQQTQAPAGVPRSEDGGTGAGPRLPAGTVAVVTGAARGIGQAIALVLASRGASVAGIDIQDLSETGKQVEDAGGRWLGVRGDLTDQAQLRAAVGEARSALGDISVLVNNAAIDDAISFDDLDLDRWRQVLTVDLEVPFLLVKEVVPDMRRRGGGSIINIASGSVVNPMARFVAYRAAKMGLIGMSRALAHELGQDSIRVNVVSPGVTMTAMAMEGLSDEVRAQSLGRQAIGRHGQPLDIAHAVAFLAGAEAEFITGQTLMVNGGMAFT